MKTVCRIACLILLLNFFLSAEKILTIDEPFKIPVLQKVDDENVYILDRPEVKLHVYSIKNPSDQFTMCKRGDGPGEFRYITNFSIWKEQYVVSGNEKLIYFDKNGRLLKEKRVPYAHSSIIPLENMFLCRIFENFPGQTIISTTLYESDFSSPKKLDEFIVDQPYRGKNRKINNYFCRDYIGYSVMNQSIIVGNTQKGFYFCVYDKRGKKLYDITKEYKKIPLTEDQKKAQLGLWKNEFGQAWYRELMASKNLVFPEYFPAYESFVAQENKIFVRLHPIIDHSQELIILDMKGKEISRHKVPIAGLLSRICIRNSRYYYLRDNPDQETWELHAAKLK